MLALVFLKHDKICWLIVSKAALSNTFIQSVHVSAEALGDEQPEVDISDDDFLQFDTSSVPVIVTLTKVPFNLSILYHATYVRHFITIRRVNFK